MQELDEFRIRDGAYEYTDAVTQQCYQIRIAESLEQKCVAWRFVYDHYLSKGYVQDNPERLFYGPHDVLPDTMTFTATLNETLLATATVISDRQIGVPADAVFHSELAEKRSKRDACFSEITSLVNCNCGGVFTSMLLFHMFKLAYLAITHIHRSTNLAITVNPSHVRFYRDILLFNHVGEAKTYDKVNGAKAVLMDLDLGQAEERYETKYGGFSGRRNLHRFFCPAAASDDVVSWFSESRDRSNSHHCTVAI